jgi:hypothetical protein
MQNVKDISIKDLTATPETAGTETTEEEGRFTIDSERAADWLVKKLAEIDAEKERIRLFARARTAELDSDAARLNHLFGEQLRQWAEQEASRRRRKSVSLPNGTLSFRTAPARLVVADLDAAADYATAQGVATKTVLDGTAYREAAEKAFAETGELWPGVTRTEEQETFTVRFPKGKEIPEGDG